MSTSLSSVWAEAWSRRDLRLHFLITLPFLAIALASLTQLLEFVERRSGVVLDDPVLAHLPPVNLTWMTFALIYAGLVVAIWFLVSHPRSLVMAMQGYTAMVFVRILMMWSVPLGPPRGMIPLVDPFVQMFSTGTVPTKDLFFSGHTSTLFLLFMAVKGKWLKIVFLACTIVVAVALLFQHVHYTIDVIVAPFVAYGCFYFATRLHRPTQLLVLPREDEHKRVLHDHPGGERDQI